MEMLDVIDENDEVIGQAEHGEIYEKELLHRICHILIFNSEGKIALQLRSKNKKFRPGHWATSVGGHVQSGETYEEAALREMEEEVGVKIPIKFLRKDWYEDKRSNGFRKSLGTFKATFNGPFNINPEEVEKVEFFSIDEIKSMIKEDEKFHPELLFLLEKEYKIKN